MNCGVGAVVRGRSAGAGGARWRGGCRTRRGRRGARRSRRSADSGRARPLRVVRQDPRVEHVRVREHEVGAGPHGAPRVLRRVPVVGEIRSSGSGPRQLLQLGQLVLRERLRGKEVEDARVAARSGAPGGRAGCSRASCPTRSASPRPRGRPCRGARAPGPGACTAPRSRAPAAPPRPGDRRRRESGPSARGAPGTGGAPSRPARLRRRVGRSARRGRRAVPRAPPSRHILGVARERCQRSAIAVQ